MVAEILATIGLFSNALDKILSKRGTKLEKKRQAIGNLQNAINGTNSYLATTNKNYAPNHEISKLWNTAFTSMVPFDRELANKLRDKGRFWSDPQSWLNHPSSMELIPKLNELENICEEMMNTINYRISKR